LECIGYYVPHLSLIGKRIPQLVYFHEATFYGEVDFSEVNFSQKVDFSGANFSQNAYFVDSTFSEKVNFWGAKFSEQANFWGAKLLAEADFLKSCFVDKALFRYTLFELQNKVTFDNSNLSNVSFADSDITRIRFGDKITWGGKDRFTIFEEEWLRNKVKGQTVSEYENVSLGLVLSVYRNLRENYEFRLRYDDAGKFFIKEMELKRKYREVPASLKENGWFGKHFSLTGLYYHLSRYGESISRPAIVGAVIVFLSTLFWVTQSNPSLEPYFSTLGSNTDAVVDDSISSTASTFVGFEKARNGTQWLKAFERSFADFLPLLSIGGEIKVGIIDYIIKIVGGALTFGLLAIALRRKFERKYTR
jgi:pentapeptide repeat protein